jgi:hypothetical protein
MIDDNEDLGNQDLPEFIGDIQNQRYSLNGINTSTGNL